MLVGTYVWNKQLSISFTSEPGAGSDHIEGSFTNYNSNITNVPLVGKIVRYDSLHGRIFIGLVGSFHYPPDPGVEPAIQYELITIHGYAETSSATDPIQTFHLIQDWTRDLPGNAEEVNTQGVMQFVRQ